MKIGVISSSFSNGGAEKVLSYLLNTDPSNFYGICLSNEFDYLIHNNFCYYNTKSYFKIHNWCYKLLFLYKHAFKFKRIITSDLIILFIITILNKLFNKNIIIIFRPSIDFNYMHNYYQKKFYNIFFKYILKYVFSNSRFIFQSNYIANTYIEKFIIKDYIIIYNPYDIENKSCSYNYAYNKPFRYLFFGRKTIEKGYDRFINISEFTDDNRFFESYGHGSYNNKFIISHHWVNLNFLDFQNSIIVIPSRIEGFPNLLIEIILRRLPVIISLETINYLVNMPDIIKYCYIVDFKKNHSDIIKEIELFEEKLSRNKLIYLDNPKNINGLIDNITYTKLVHKFILTFNNGKFN